MISTLLKTSRTGEGKGWKAEVQQVLLWGTQGGGGGLLSPQEQALLSPQEQVQCLRTLRFETPQAQERQVGQDPSGPSGGGVKEIKKVATIT